jgi:vacuolar-type H+-ATPase subunit F/Vma7
MAICHFIGDEITALGFRLAGASIQTPALAEVASVLRELRGRPGLLVLTADCAAAVPAAQLQAAMIAAEPLLVLIPSAAGGMPAPDLAAAVRQQLGMSE